MSWDEPVQEQETEPKHEELKQKPARKSGSGKKANMPDILDSDDFTGAEKTDVIELLERGHRLKAAIGVKPDEKKGTGGSGMLKDLYDVTEMLGICAASHGLEGLRHMKLAYTQRLQDGRKVLDTEKFVQELLMNGVNADVIKACMEAATKQGDSYWVREISVLS